MKLYSFVIESISESCYVIENTLKIYKINRMVLVHIQAYNCKTITILCCFQINIHWTPLPKCSSEKKFFIMAEDHV